tara:strand:- start:227 stop:409 length:183 start_codon:yes stop_codon:yes gene_type:complete
MSTTKQSEDNKSEWESMIGGKEPPKQLKEYIEKMIEFNNTAKEILKDTRDWLILNGNNSR